MRRLPGAEDGDRRCGHDVGVQSGQDQAKDYEEAQSLFAIRRKVDQDRCSPSNWIRPKAERRARLCWTPEPQPGQYEAVVEQELGPIWLGEGEV